MPQVVSSKDDFDQALKDNAIVLVDFHATWCGPCKMIAPYLEELEKEYPTIKVLKIDVDEVEEVAQDQNVNAMPTFMVFKNGSKVDDMVGASKDKLKELFEKNK